MMYFKNLELPKNYEDLTSEKRIALAQSQGLVAIRPRWDELQLDIDSEEQWKIHEERWKWFLRFHAAMNWEEPRRTIRNSKSLLPFHYHITVRLIHSLPLDDCKRVMLQQALGSDPNREFCGALRVYVGAEDPTLFFEKPAQIGVDYGQVIERKTPSKEGDTIYDEDNPFS